MNEEENEEEPTPYVVMCLEMQARLLADPPWEKLTEALREAE